MAISPRLATRTLLNLHSAMLSFLPESNESDRVKQTPFGCGGSPAAMTPPPGVRGNAMLRLIIAVRRIFASDFVCGCKLGDTHRKFNRPVLHLAVSRRGKGPCHCLGNMLH